MPGLLDFLQTPDAQLGLGLLAAAGPSAQPMSAGQRIAMALQGVQAQKDAELKRQYVQSQIGENNSQAVARQSQMQQERAIQDFVGQRMRQGVPSQTQPGPPDAQYAPSSVFPGGPFGFPRPTSPQPGSPEGGRSNFLLSLPEITSLTALGAKQGPALFEQFKYATDGVKREAGNFYKDPITGEFSYVPKLDTGMTVAADGKVRPMDGYAASNAAIKGTEAGAVASATEKAKFPYAVAADRDRQETQASLDMIRAVGDDGNEYYVPRLAMASGGKAASGSGSPVPLIGPGAGARFVAGRNPVTQQSQIALNDNWLKNSYQPTLDSGKSAANTQAGIQAIRNIDMNTGWGTEAKAYAASVLEGLGVTAGNAQMFAASAQKFQAVAMDKVNSELLLQKGVQAKDDAERAKQTFVSLRNTPEANRFILDFAQAKANMDQRRAQYYEAALPLAQKSGDLTRVDREWRKVAGSIWADPILQPWKK